MKTVPEIQELLKILDQVSDHVTIIDSRLHFLWANKAYCKSLNISRDELISLNLKDVISEDYYPFLEEKLLELDSITPYFDNIYPTLLEDGSVLIEKWQNRGVFDKNGKLQFFYSTASFEYETEKPNLNIRDRELISNTLVQSSVMGFLVVLENRVLFINHKTYEIFGIPPFTSLEDISPADFFELAMPGFSYRSAAAKNPPDDEQPVKSEKLIKRPDNADAWISIITKNMVVNKKHAHLFIFEDITERKNNEIETRKARDNLKKLMHIARMGYWERDFKTGNWLWSDEVYEIFELPIGTEITENILDDIIDPEYMKIRRGLIKESLSGDEYSHNYHYEYKIYHKNGGMKWISGKSFYEKDPETGYENFYGWVQDITERKYFEEELIRAKIRAEESEKLKTNFLANMSHEIRTPLNAILGFSDLLTRGSSPEEQIKFKEIINQSSRLLLKIIDDILDFSTIEAGSLELVRESVTITAIFNEIRQIFSEQNNSDVCLEIAYPEEGLEVYADRERLKQVIINLINNAFKYTNEGCIKLSCRKNPADKTVVFSVKDTGIGITEDKQGIIFDRFYQADSFSKGTGLGLAISRSIIESMGGNITVNSQPGVGSDFIFTLPVK